MIVVKAFFYRQMAVLKKLHWRSVRQDVKTFILHCEFCIRKKVEGKKILKAPVDISSRFFSIVLLIPLSFR